MHLEALNDHYITMLSRQMETDPMLFVPGEGKAEAPKLVLVGEAPGEQETKMRRPFVGKAGKNLDGFLDTLGLAREDIYITNVVKVRPTRQSERGRLSNRPPNRREKEAFTPWLMQEIGILRPRLIVTLGNTPLQALLGREARVGDMHGQWQLWRGIPLYPMYHPAAVIYRRELAGVCQQDAQALARFLHEHNEC